MFTDNSEIYYKALGRNDFLFKDYNFKDPQTKFLKLKEAYQLSIDYNRLSSHSVFSKFLDYLKDLSNFDIDELYIVDLARYCKWFIDENFGKINLSVSCQECRKKKVDTQIPFSYDISIFDNCTIPAEFNLGEFTILNLKLKDYNHIMDLLTNPVLLGDLDEYKYISFFITCMIKQENGKTVYENYMNSTNENQDNIIQIMKSKVDQLPASSYKQLRNIAETMFPKREMNFICPKCNNKIRLEVKLFDPISFLYFLSENTMNSIIKIYNSQDIIPNGNITAKSLIDNLETNDK